MCWIQVKADVETQGDFVQSLATEVRAASFSNIDDLEAFVNWLDEELSFLVCPYFLMPKIWLLYIRANDCLR
jgi:hypothetical protein